MKELILIAKHQSWAQRGFHNWDNTEWMVYDDCSVDVMESYGVHGSHAEKAYTNTLSKANDAAILITVFGNS